MDCTGYENKTLNTKQNTMKFNQINLDAFRKGNQIIKNDVPDITVMQDFIIQSGVKLRYLHNNDFGKYLSVNVKGNIIYSDQRPLHGCVVNLSHCIEKVEDEIDKELREREEGCRKAFEAGKEAFKNLFSNSFSIDFGYTNPSAWHVYAVNKEEECIKELEKRAKKLQAKEQKQHDKAKYAYYTTGKDMEYFDEADGVWRKCQKQRIYRFIKKD